MYDLDHTESSCRKATSILKCNYDYIFIGNNDYQSAFIEQLEIDNQSVKIIKIDKLMIPFGTKIHTFQ